jgi:hypothetical protein
MRNKLLLICAMLKSVRRVCRNPATVGVVVAVIVLMTAATVTLAISPHDQRISDAPVPLRLGATGVFGSGELGTGTVVGAKLDGTTGYVSILTAAHVAKEKPMSFALGQGFGGNPYSLIFSTGPFISYKIDAAANPNKLPVDVAVVTGKIRDLNAGSQALNSFNILKNNLPTVTSPADNPLVNPNAVNPTPFSPQVPFTQIGYGLQGEYKANIDNVNNPGTTFQGFQSTGQVGERLFQNNFATQYAPPHVVQAYNPNEYYQPMVEFDVLGPPNNSGRGGAMRGDSGGPLYTDASNPGVVTVNRGGNNIAIQIQHTNSLSAVFVGLQVFRNNTTNEVALPETTPISWHQWGVPINQGIYNWMQPYVGTDPKLIVPEPATPILLAVVVLIFLLSRRPKYAFR